MKNKSFKRLGDDTKKTEKTLKLYHIGMIVNAVILTVVIFFIIVFVFLKPNLFSKKSSKSAEEKAKILQQKDAESTYKIPFSEFKIAKSNDNYFIIGNENNTWKEIFKVNENTNLIGTYKNRLYYFDNQAISYINFENSGCECIEWLKYSKYKVEETDQTGILNICTAYIIDENIYFKYDLNIASSSPTSGILTINVYSNSLSEAKQLLPDVSYNEWSCDTKNKLIYYIKNSKDLYKFDLVNSSEELMLSNVKSFQIDQENILYLKSNNQYKEPDNSIVQAATYYLSMYNVVTKEDKIVYESAVSNVSTGKLCGFAQIYNQEIYYKADNKIIKHSNGENIVIYTYFSNDLTGFKIMEDNVIELLLQDNENKYLINGQIFDDMPKLYTVTMKDGTTQQL